MPLRYGLISMMFRSRAHEGGALSPLKRQSLRETDNERPRSSRQQIASEINDFEEELVRNGGTSGCPSDKKGWTTFSPQFGDSQERWILMIC